MAGLMFVLFIVGGVIMVSRFLQMNPGFMAQLQSGGGAGSWLNNGELDVGGRTVKFHYKPSSRNSPSRLQGCLTGDFFAHALFRLENGADRAAKNIGLSREIELRDPSFDNAVYVECEDQSFVEQFLNSPESRDHLRNILRVFNSFEINGRTCAMVKSPCDGAWRAQEEPIKSAAGSMAALAARIPVPEPGQISATPASDANRSLTIFIIGTAFVFLVTGIGFLVWGFTLFPPLLPQGMFSVSLRASALLAGFFVFYIFYAVRNTSTAMRVLVVSVAAGGLGLVFLCWGGMMVINGSQDVSLKVPHPVRIIGKSIARSKKSHTYHIRTSSWTSLVPDYSFSVPSSEYYRLEANDPCVITTGSGFFKFEWVSSRACTKAVET
ncbi:MAG: hypothetical protein WCI27_05205 [Candidatus Omnitrophota bacterium]